MSWWSERKARKRFERIAANTRDLDSGVMQKVGAPLGLANDRQWYTVDWWEHFVIDGDGRRRAVWHEVDEIR